MTNQYSKKEQAKFILEKLADRHKETTDNLLIAIDIIDETVKYATRNDDTNLALFLLKQMKRL